MATSDTRILLPVVSTVKRNANYIYMSVYYIHDSENMS